MPRAARSFVLVCTDPNAQKGVFHHWVLFDLPPNIIGLGEGQMPLGARAAVNDFGTRGYAGPCPPRGHGSHHYTFELLALAVQHLDCGYQPSGINVLQTARQNACATARLTGLYAR